MSSNDISSLPKKYHIYLTMNPEGEERDFAVNYIKWLERGKTGHKPFIGGPRTRERIETECRTLFKYVD